METLKTRFNNLQYEHFKITFKGLVIEVKLLDENSTFPNYENKEEVEEFKVIISNGDNKINFKFYNSIMERKISQYLKENFKQYPTGLLKVRDFRAYMSKMMWGGYDKVKNRKELNQERIYHLFYSILNSLAMDRITETESFKFFCDNFGYDEDSRKAEKIFKAVIEQKEKIDTLNLTAEQTEYLDEQAQQETEKFSQDVRKAILTT